MELVTPLETAQDALRGVRDDLQQVIFGTTQREAIDALLVGLISGRHVLLGGPRGTGKTTLVDSLVARIDGLGAGDYYGTALHPMKELDEIFGGTDIDALVPREGRPAKLRKALDRMAFAKIVLLDEMSRGNDATLEGLFDPLEKRRIENEGVYHKLPLWLAIGAANAPFESDRLSPLRDRMPVGIWLDYVPEAEQSDLLNAYLGGFPSDEAYITVAQVEELRAAVKTVALNSVCRKLLWDVAKECRNQGIDVSDRRVLVGADLLKGHALMHGRSEVLRNDFRVIDWCFWDWPDDAKKVRDIREEIVGDMWSEQIADYDKQVNSLLFNVVPANAHLILRRVETAALTAQLPPEGHSQRWPLILLALRNETNQLKAAIDAFTASVPDKYKPQLVRMAGSLNEYNTNTITQALKQAMSNKQK